MLHSVRYIFVHDLNMFNQQTLLDFLSAMFRLISHIIQTLFSASIGLVVVWTSKLGKLTSTSWNSRCFCTFLKE